MIKVGTSSFGYNHWRNFVGLPFENVVFEKVQDFYKIPAYLHYKLLRKVNYKYVNRFNDFALNNVDIYHFFNTLSPVKNLGLLLLKHLYQGKSQIFVKVMIG